MYFWDSDILPPHLRQFINRQMKRQIKIANSSKRGGMPLHGSPDMAFEKILKGANEALAKDKEIKRKAQEVVQPPVQEPEYIEADEAEEIIED